MSKKKQREPHGETPKRKRIGGLIAAVLVVCLVIGIYLVQDAMIYTADGVEFVPEILWGGFAGETDSASTQATMPHATTAISGLVQPIRFKPQVEGQVEVENVTLPLSTVNPNRLGRLLTFGEYAVTEFAATAHLMAEGGETLAVFDLKEPSGKLAYISSTSVAQRANANASASEDYYLREAVKQLHQEGISVAARIACLADSRLADASESMILSDTAGLPCRNAAGYVLLNPEKRELQSYLVAVAQEAVAMGFDTLILDDFGCPASSAADQEDLLTLIQEIREQVGDCTLSLMVYSSEAYVQSASLRNSADELWSCRKEVDADYFLDSVGSVSTTENQ